MAWATAGAVAYSQTRLSDESINCSICYPHESRRRPVRLRTRETADALSVLMSPTLLRPLSPIECMELLGSCRVGRVGTTMGVLPVILPVNYSVFDDGVLIRTAEGTQLDAAIRDLVVAFQADSYDRSAGSGWSVLLIGKAQEVSDAVKLERAQATPIEKWPGADGLLHYMHIKAVQITGRRFVKRPRHRPRAVRSEASIIQQYMCGPTP